MTPQPTDSDPRRSARGLVSAALARAAAHFPDLDPMPLDTTALDGRDARLALAIHRTALQRWITLEYLLDQFLRQPMHSVEPALRGVLLAAAAQLVFMDRLPTHAVVDESVALTRALVRPGATGLANAVLRRLAELRLRGTGLPPGDPPANAVLRRLAELRPTTTETPSAQAWEPAADRLPTEDGFIRLTRPVLPSPSALVYHLAIATSHPPELLQRWVDRFGAPKATELARHGIVAPPTIVAVEPGFPGAGAGPSAAGAPPGDGPTAPWTPHARPGFVVWNAGHEELVAFLKQNPARRVQDPGSTLAVAATANLKPSLILDYCAGRGTKTRQLAQQHPMADIIATDLEPQRLAALAKVLKGTPRARAVPIGQVAAALGTRRADLILLDVPCSNTAVLARRPEARYRLSLTTLAALTELQRKIAAEVLPMLAPGGTVLYSTCSLEAAEDQQQAAGIAGHIHGQVREEKLELPGGAGVTYHDGGYYALIR